MLGVLTINLNSSEQSLELDVGSSPITFAKWKMEKRKKNERKYAEM